MYCHDVAEVGTQLSTLVKSDMVYRCLSDIVCKNGRFSKDSLVMLQPDCCEKDLLNVADFVPISRNSIGAEGNCYDFSLADVRCVDTFTCEPSVFFKCFEEAVDINESLENNSRRIAKLFDVFALGHGVAALAILIICIVTFSMFGISEPLYRAFEVMVVVSAVSLMISFKLIQLHERHLKKRLYESLA